MLLVIARSTLMHVETNFKSFLTSSSLSVVLYHDSLVTCAYARYKSIVFAYGLVVATGLADLFLSLSVSLCFHEKMTKSLQSLLPSKVFYFVFLFYSLLEGRLAWLY